MLQDNNMDADPVRPTTPISATLSIMGDVLGTREDSSEVDSPPPRRYGTRPANVDRRPGKDFGLNWKADKLEREAAEAAQAQKRSEAAAKKQDKSQRAAHEEAGVQRIAGLEAARTRADREDRARVDKRTAHAYRAPPADATGDSNNDNGENNVSSPTPDAVSRTQSKVRRPHAVYHSVNPLLTRRPCRRPPHRSNLPQTSAESVRQRSARASLMHIPTRQARPVHTMIYINPHSTSIPAVRFIMLMTLFPL